MTGRTPARREDVEAYLYRILGRRPRANETRAFTRTNRASSDEQRESGVTRLDGANTMRDSDSDELEEYNA